MRKINAYKIALAKLEDRFGREPTDAEMADELSWALKELIRLRTELGRADLTLGGGFGKDYAYGDLGIISEKTPTAIKLVYFDSTADEKYIMEHIYPLFGKEQMPIRLIAKKLKLKESKVKYMISDIKRKIIENL
jgi:DNA-directed RNA polymerase specialized sigma subunit